MEQPAKVRHNVRMATRLLAALAIIASVACQARLDDPQVGQPDAPSSDASTQIDAPVVDAAIDARPCMGGQTSATDPMTGQCFVYFTGPLQYADAVNACIQFDAQIAVIKSAQTNTTVTSLIAQTDAFVGATDRTTEGTYLWRDAAGDPVTGGYTNWRTGEPNDGGTNGEDCMIIEGEQGGTWDDRPCATGGGGGAYAYICQY